ncbi:hypothetical protein [Streptantibioticus ferralitis]|uniref:Transglutaminase-like domain-containing protein n=1 Tax=Streptantibioticus ferralitis TaxID=236510 RepID=A0ABT5Z9D6_9ACTN|nr:hypothetical protein [Streptantibioticus ferralitis]MDF2260438.1 hypothetical protein [Streptantibioticus ferralitis]
MTRPAAADRARRVRTDVWLAALDEVVLTPEAYRERTMTRQQALNWLFCPPETFAALTAAGLPEVGRAPDTSEPLYDFHDVVNVGIVAGEGTTTGELSERALLRYAASAPQTWVAPRQWSVELSYTCSHQDRCTQGAWEVADPALEEFDGQLHALSVMRSAAGSAIAVQVRCTVQGSRRDVVAPEIREVYRQALADFRSGRRRYQWMPAPLRHDPARAKALGLADCLVTSGELAADLAAAGYTTRTRTVSALGLAGIDHAWAEVMDTDGQWKFLDPVFAHLALRRPGTRPEYEEFCLGSSSNRLLPWAAAATDGVVRHHCAHPTSIITTTITTGAPHDART